MLVIYSTLVVLAATRSASAAEKDPHPYCFQFTWLGRTTADSVNCSELTDAPCVEPFVVTLDETPPNVTYMWENINRTAISCPLSRGFACLKYTYYYNDAALNTTYFCGKMVEDLTIPISDGCYTQKTRGHVIEACACQSGGGMMPCNSSIRGHTSINALIVVASISMLMYSRFFATGLSFDVRKLSLYG